VKSDVRIVEPGQMEAPVGEIPLLFLPQADVFVRRASRLRSLAANDPLGGYLSFLAVLADAQQQSLDRFPVLSLPSPDEQARDREEGKPMLDARSHPRDPAWRKGLAVMLQKMVDEEALPTATREAISALMRRDDTALEEMADKILANEFGAVSPQELPFVAAALQVYWVRMALLMNKASFGIPGKGGVCPLCGSLPMVGVVRSGGQEQGLRYLSCSLCASEWHMVRIKCSTCGSTEGIDYFTLEGSEGAVKAESCGNCDSYLKLLYFGKDAQMDATADDLATLALDMLMEREGKMRGGPNLLFHPGNPQ
jgi:FdhE protein